MREAMRAGYLGQIITPAAGNRLDEQYVEWIADNGIYSNAYPGDAAYISWLDSHSDMRFRCRFAVAPDVVADHKGTLERSWPMLRPIRRAVGRVALCAQNGATPDDLPWDYIDAVFLAGIVECVPCGYVPAVTELPITTCPLCRRGLVEWKVSDMAAQITAEARRRGKWVHMGRVNTDTRIRRAREMGCDSGDGTFLAFGPDVNLPILLNWLHPDDFRFMRPSRRESRVTAKPKASARPDLFSTSTPTSNPIPESVTA